MTPKPFESTKNTNARKQLCQFTETLYVKHKTAVSRFGVAKEKCKTIKKAMDCGKTFQSDVLIKNQ